MKSFILSLQFLTILPVRVSSPDVRQMSRAAAFFPTVGLLIAILPIAANTLLAHLHINPIAQAAIAIILLIATTGALHLDGLSDTADAFMSGKDRLEMLRIMRDSHAGAMGVVSVVCVIVLQISLFASIGSGIKNVALILACVLSRFSMTYSLFGFPYARAEGKAKAFKDGMNVRIFAAGAATALMFSVAIGGAAGAILFAITGGFTFALNSYFRKRIGGVTGDTIGAVCELTVVLVLFCIMILEKIFV